MSELKLNYKKMGILPKGHSCKWYTEKVNKLAVIHVHNATESGLWAFEVHLVGELKKSAGFSHKEQAWIAARAWVYMHLQAAIQQLEQTNE